MWEFYITESDLWWMILRRFKDDDWFWAILWYQWKWMWTKNKDFAKTYYPQEKATSDLILLRRNVRMLEKFW